LSLVMELSVNRGWKNMFDKDKLEQYLKDLIWKSEVVS
jgi:hypothetical protein